MQIQFKKTLIEFSEGKNILSFILDFEKPEELYMFMNAFQEWMNEKAKKEQNVIEEAPISRCC